MSHHRHLSERIGYQYLLWWNTVFGDNHDEEAAWDSVRSPPRMVKGPQMRSACRTSGSLLSSPCLSEEIKLFRFLEVSVPCASICIPILRAMSVVAKRDALPLRLAGRPVAL